MTLAVIGAGFGRTGTLSFKIALEMLELAPCYHMVEVLQHEGHAQLWHQAADAPVPDWRMLHGYQAAVDWPVCYFWRELAASFPQAKIVLTLRDSQRWYQSVYETIYQWMRRPVSEQMSPIARAQHVMATDLILQRTFGGRFEDRAHAIAVYECHNERVQRSLPAERLLVYEVSQGWAPLCNFLGLPIPEAPFPQVNSTDEFKSRLRL
jgi:hypothetical protein